MARDRRSDHPSPLRATVMTSNPTEVPSEVHVPSGSPTEAPTGIPTGGQLSNLRRPPRVEAGGQPSNPRVVALLPPPTSAITNTSPQSRGTGNHSPNPLRRFVAAGDRQPNPPLRPRTGVAGVSPLQYVAPVAAEEQPAEDRRIFEYDYTKQ